MPATDLYPLFLDKLREAGLVLDHMETDGLLYRCGTSAKPKGKDGAYSAHMDAPASLWWQNWHTGEDGTYCPVKKADMTAAERETLKRRIAEARARREAEEERRHAEAANTAATRWGGAPTALDTHPYLMKKGVPSFGLRLRGNQLLVPVYDDAGKLASLQTIDPDGEKRFLSGGKMKGGTFFIPARDGKTATVLIAEGYATAASACMASGYAAFVAFNAGNLLSVAMRARRLFPESKLIVVADDDWELEQKTGKNTGLVAAEEAARRVGGWLAVPSVRDTPGASDINDLHKKGGVDAVWRCLAAARIPDDEQTGKEPMPTPENSGENSPPSPAATGNGLPVSTLPDGYFMVPEGPRAGLYYSERRRGKEHEVRLGPPIRLLGRTCDEHNIAWGFLLEWKDPKGTLHRWALPGGMLQQSNREWAWILADGGYDIASGQTGRFIDFLQKSVTANFITCVPRVGWHNDAFVLPDRAYGDGGDSIVLQSLNHGDMYQAGGTREAWNQIAALSAGNTRLEFALSTAFAGPLLRLADVEGGGFSFEGGSSCGKTTCLEVAASVWGGASHVRPWRTTDNGLESIAALHNDGLLILDEVGQVSAKVLSESAYMLANGQGKTRSGKDGNTRKSTPWRLLFLSSGEVGLAEKLQEGGIKAKAGQEVRFVGIPTEKEMLSNLHGLSDSGAVSNRLKELSGRHYGHAGREFLQWLTEHRAEVVLGIGARLDDGVKCLCPANAGEQVRRVARRFALVAYAGELAKSAGVFPAEMDVWAAVASCFNDWLSARGSVGASEDAEVEAAVQRFIEQHGASRFENIETPGVQRIPNRVGFVKMTKDGAEYYVLPESFKTEVLAGISFKRAIRILTDKGWLVRGSGTGRDATVKKNLPGMGRVRCYQIVPPREDLEPDGGDE